MLSRHTPFLFSAHSPLASAAMAVPAITHIMASPCAAAILSSHSRLKLPYYLPPLLRPFLLRTPIFGTQVSGCRDDRNLRFPLPMGFGKVFASRREYRSAKQKPSRKKDQQLELSVKICIEEQLPNDPEILSISETFRVNVPAAMKLALDNLQNSDYKTRDTVISDVSGFETVELSVLLCNDEFIRELNKDWRGEDHATDVLSMSQHIPELKLPILMLGDIVISVDTARRQAEEREHTIMDEMHILLVHGLLHLMGFDHEISDEAEAEMEKVEEHMLKSLGWKGKGLIQSAYVAEANNPPDERISCFHC